MKIQKAVITAAGPKQRSLPLQSLVDPKGAEKSALAIIVDEAQSAGIDDVCIVVHPRDAESYGATLEHSQVRITFTTQDEPRGYGHALFCAREFVGDDPFLHFVSDHLWVGHGERTCAQELVAVAEAESAAVSAVQETRENMLPYYGVVSGLRVPKRNDLYVVENVAEKPTPTEAEQTLTVPGLRAGHYLCLFGMHALTPTVMNLLADEVQNAGARPVSLTGALAKLADRKQKGTYLAFQVPGRRYNIGVKYGLLNAQLALSLSGVHREEVLAQLLELLALRETIAAQER